MTTDDAGTREDAEEPEEEEEGMGFGADEDEEDEEVGRGGWSEAIVAHTPGKACTKVHALCVTPTLITSPIPKPPHHPSPTNDQEEEDEEEEYSEDEDEDEFEDARMHRATEAMLDMGGEAPWGGAATYTTVRPPSAAAAAAISGLGEGWLDAALDAPGAGAGGPVPGSFLMRGWDRDALGMGMGLGRGGGGGGMGDEEEEEDGALPLAWRGGAGRWHFVSLSVCLSVTLYDAPSAWGCFFLPFWGPGGARRPRLPSRTTTQPTNHPSNHPTFDNTTSSHTHPHN